MKRSDLTQDVGGNCTPEDFLAEALPPAGIGIVLESIKEKILDRLKKKKKEAVAKASGHCHRNLTQDAVGKTKGNGLLAPVWMPG